MSDSTEKSWKPRASFRFIVNVPGVESYQIARIESNRSREVELWVYWVEGEPMPEAKSHADGTVKLLDRQGKVTEEMKFAWDQAITDPFNFDYAELKTLIRIRLIGVYYFGWKKPE